MYVWWISLVPVMVDVFSPLWIEHRTDWQGATIQYYYLEGLKENS